MQVLKQVDSVSDVRLALQEFLLSKGLLLERLSADFDTEIDAFELFLLVEDHGGFEEVTEQKLWTEVGLVAVQHPGDDCGKKCYKFYKDTFLKMRTEMVNTGIFNPNKLIKRKQEGKSQQSKKQKQQKQQESKVAGQKRQLQSQDGDHDGLIDQKAQVPSQPKSKKQKLTGQCLQQQRQNTKDEICDVFGHTTEDDTDVNNHANYCKTSGKQLSYKEQAQQGLQLNPKDDPVLDPDTDDFMKVFGCSSDDDTELIELKHGCHRAGKIEDAVDVQDVFGESTEDDTATKQASLVNNSGKKEKQTIQKNVKRPVSAQKSNKRKRPSAAQDVYYSQNEYEEVFGRTSDDEDKNDNLTYGSKSQNKQVKKTDIKLTSKSQKQKQQGQEQEQRDISKQIEQVIGVFMQEVPGAGKKQQGGRKKKGKSSSEDEQNSKKGNKKKKQQQGQFNVQDVFGHSTEDESQNQEKTAKRKSQMQVNSQREIQDVFGHSTEDDELNKSKSAKKQGKKRITEQDVFGLSTEDEGVPDQEKKQTQLQSPTQQTQLQLQKLSEVKSFSQGFAPTKSKMNVQLYNKRIREKLPTNSRKPHDLKVPQAFMKEGNKQREIKANSSHDEGEVGMQQKNRTPGKNHPDNSLASIVEEVVNVFGASSQDEGQEANNKPQKNSENGKGKLRRVSADKVNKSEQDVQMKKVSFEEQKEKIAAEVFGVSSQDEGDLNSNVSSLQSPKQKAKTPKASSGKRKQTQQKLKNASSLQQHDNIVVLKTLEDQDEKLTIQDEKQAVFGDTSDDNTPSMQGINDKGQNTTSKVILINPGQEQCKHDVFGKSTDDENQEDVHVQNEDTEQETKIPCEIDQNDEENPSILPASAKAMIESSFGKGALKSSQTDHINASQQDEGGSVTKSSSGFYSSEPPQGRCCLGLEFPRNMRFPTKVQVATVARRFGPLSWVDFGYTKHRVYVTFVKEATAVAARRKLAPQLERFLNLDDGILNTVWLHPPDMTDRFKYKKDYYYYEDRSHADDYKSSRHPQQQSKENNLSTPRESQQDDPNQPQKPIRPTTLQSDQVTFLPNPNPNPNPTNVTPNVDTAPNTYNTPQSNFQSPPAPTIVLHNPPQLVAPSPVNPAAFQTPYLPQPYPPPQPQLQPYPCPQPLPPPQTVFHIEPIQNFTQGIQPNIQNQGYQVYGNQGYGVSPNTLSRTPCHVQGNQYGNRYDNQVGSYQAEQIPYNYNMQPGSFNQLHNLQYQADRLNASSNPIGYRMMNNVGNDIGGYLNSSIQIKDIRDESQEVLGSGSLQQASPQTNEEPVDSTTDANLTQLPEYVPIVQPKVGVCGTTIPVADDGDFLIPGLGDEGAEDQIEQVADMYNVLQAQNVQSWDKNDDASPQVEENQHNTQDQSRSWSTIQADSQQDTQGQVVQTPDNMLDDNQQTLAKPNVEQEADYKAPLEQADQYHESSGSDMEKLAAPPSNMLRSLLALVARREAEQKQQQDDLQQREPQYNFQQQTQSSQEQEEDLQKQKLISEPNIQEKSEMVENVKEENSMPISKGEERQLVQLEGNQFDKEPSPEEPNTAPVSEQLSKGEDDSLQSDKPANVKSKLMQLFGQLGKN